MPSLLTSLLIVLLLILVNALFVMSEMAIISARKIRLQQVAERGNKGAKAALDLANNPNNFLSAGQAGITLIAIVSGAFGEQTLSRFFKPLLDRIPVLMVHSEGLSFGISVLAIAYLTLVIGELVPKRLALNSPEVVASAIARPMGFLAKLLAPIVHLLSTSTEMVLKMLGIRPSNEPQVTEEEIKLLIAQGTEAGMFEQAEEDIVKRVFQLGDRRVNSIMTPRVEIVYLDVDAAEEVNRRTLQDESLARLPVCQGELDRLLGVVQIYDLLREMLAGQLLDLTKSLQAPLFVPESTRALKVLELFKQSSNQIAFVVDEYGVIQGLVTLTDILQALVGDLPSAEGLEEPQILRREDGSFLLDGMLPIYQLKELLDIENKQLPNEQRGSYQTLGGFVVMHLGRIPSSTDRFTWEGLQFEVVDMDGNRVDKVMVTPAVPAAESEDETS
jgi:putative hemolysin